MVKILFSLLLLCILRQSSYAQDKGIDARAAAIPEVNCVSVDALVSYIKQNFTTDADRVRAIYVWITNNIGYDVQRFLEREKYAGILPPSIAEVLATRKAVCQGYAELFIAICKGEGINAIIVPGYTKKQGRVSPVSHAWVALPLGDEWNLFDPTWGAGYVKDDQFIRKFNNAFFKMSPANFISDHMPFDPMYQFLSYPITHKEFIDGKQGANKTLFTYNDSLKQYSQLSSVQQNAAELRRLEAAGVDNDLLRERELFLKNTLQSFASKNSFDEGVKTFRDVISRYKEFIGHKNKQFSTIGDNDLRQMVDSMEQNVKLSRSLLSEMKPKTDAQEQAKTNTIGNMDRFWMQLIKEKQFVDQYFAADKAGRKQLFMRR
jgi:hypothetical protein